MHYEAPKLGIGMVFSTALHKLLQRRPEALDLLEIEPQTLWLADDAYEGPFYEYTPGIDLFAAMPGHKLVHSVGMPLGGRRAPDPGQLALLAATADKLESPWVSEHLSIAGTPHHAAGFLLPPLQTDEGVEIAVSNIRAFAAAVGRPVAIETGVAYFRRKPFEMMDGAFVARIAEEAGCGILLDLHNIYCNEKNERISMDDFLADIPLDRVWEVHLAGGTEKEGYWLDSHSGPMPSELRDRALDIVRALPNLGAINFEIYDTFLKDIDLATFDRIVDDMREIWVQAGAAGGSGDSGKRQEGTTPTRQESPPASVESWEEGVTDAVWKADPVLHPWQSDRKPLSIYSDLARSFRGSMLMRGLPRMLRYLILRDGYDVEGLLNRYFDSLPPRLYAPLEAEAFRKWLIADGEDDALALSLLDYDMAFMRIVRDGKPQLVRFPGDPRPVFEALAGSRLPTMPAPPIWEMEILPDAFSVADFAMNSMES